MKNVNEILLHSINFNIQDNLCNGLDPSVSTVVRYSIDRVAIGDYNLVDIHGPTISPGSTQVFTAFESFAFLLSNDQHQNLNFEICINSIFMFNYATLMTNNLSYFTIEYH